MIAYWFLVLHFVGDYVLQSDWMAAGKSKQWAPAITHAAVYTAPFALVLPQWEPLALIGLSHLLIDRFRLARFVCWGSSFFGPPNARAAWGECRATGYGPAKPAWLATMLLFVVDNTMHLAINGMAWVLWGVA